MRRLRGKKLILCLTVPAFLLGMAGCGSVKMTLPQTEPEDTESEVRMLSDSSVVGRQTNDKLETISDLIDKNFYFEEEEKQLQDGIIRGYMEALNDPYSVYYNAEEYASFLEDSGGEYVGVGVQVSQNPDTNVITVVKVFKDGPAEAAGLQAEDIIDGVDGEDVGDQDIDTVVKKIRGQEGTDVILNVYRSSDGKKYDLKMKRRKVENPTVTSEMLDHNIGYVSVSSFYEVTAKQYKEAVEELKEQGMEGLIVDLRDNGGGLLDIAVEMLDYMLPEGKLVYTEDKDGNVTSEYNSSDEEKFELPLIVLVNGYSASASEIFAGAIKDYGTGKLVGTNTFGKGIVQRMFPLSDGSAVKLTIAKYFTPNGNDIHKIGIKPDVEVEFDAMAYRESNGEKDNQLDKAKECMLEMLGVNPAPEEQPEE